MGSGKDPEVSVASIPPTLLSPPKPTPRMLRVALLGDVNSANTSAAVNRLSYSRSVSVMALPCLTATTVHFPGAKARKFSQSFAFCDSPNVTGSKDR